jgi:hypothetical protein
MKIVLTKFRISNSLDRGHPLPAATRARIAGSEELRDFAERAAELEQALRRPPRSLTVDDALHRSIMGAVRATAAERMEERRAGGLWLAPVLGLALLVAAVIWLERPRPVATPVAGAGKAALAVVSKALEAGGQISSTVPTEMIAPLSNEWARVDSDLRGATQFVLASLP